MNAPRAFEIRVPGKWVLTGEHAVLRGETALALPHPEWSLHLSFMPAPGDSEHRGLEVEPEAARELIHLIIASFGPRLPFVPAGKLQIQSSIPIGAGLGSSAALCVAITEWLREPLRARPEEVRGLATELEHRFHGKSSGMDVAVVLERRPILFRRGEAPELLELEGGLPRFTFHDTGLRARTQDCVEKVEAFRERSPVASREVDEAMGLATRLATEGLQAYGRLPSLDSLQKLAQGINQAQECFRAWDLDPIEAQNLRNSLIQQGALAAKLTGAGAGGMIVALWEH